MTISLRRALLAVLSAIGAFVGLWALLAPASFYADFPGVGLRWVSDDGPFNEHLVRDVGALYLALTAAGIAAIVSRLAAAARVAAIAWIVFSVPHLAYHLGHGGDPLEVVALTSTVVLPLPLLLPLSKDRP